LSLAAQIHKSSVPQTRERSKVPSGETKKNIGRKREGKVNREIKA
jgi:hypothetical protein